jgi:hypothetical protein
MSGVTATSVSDPEQTSSFERIGQPSGAEFSHLLQSMPCAPDFDRSPEVNATFRQAERGVAAFSSQRLAHYNTGDLICRADARP